MPQDSSLLLGLFPPCTLWAFIYCAKVHVNISVFSVEPTNVSATLLNSVQSCVFWWTEWQLSMCSSRTILLYRHSPGSIHPLLSRDSWHRKIRGFPDVKVTPTWREEIIEWLYISVLLFAITHLLAFQWAVGELGQTFLLFCKLEPNNPSWLLTKAFCFSY